MTKTCNPLNYHYYAYKRNEYPYIDSVHLWSISPFFNCTFYTRRETDKFGEIPPSKNTRSFPIPTLKP